MKSHLFLSALVFAILSILARRSGLVFATVSHDPNHVHFYLYSNSNEPNLKQELIYNNSASITESEFKPGTRTVFIIHGFRNGYNSTMPQVVKNAYLNSSLMYNYIIVDWKNLSTPQPPQLTAALYTLAVKNVPIVGRRVSDFVKFLERNNFTDFSKIHIVGNSLGAHVSGLAGYYYMTNTTKIDRITGLDPAGPLFYPPISARNLVKGDASFVDVIHTNMGELGDKTEDGHADFYPNGGITQTNCKQNDSILPDPSNFGTCSHRFSYKLYVASFTKDFPSCKCSPFFNLFIFCQATCSQPVLLGVNCPSRLFLKYRNKSHSQPSLSNYSASGQFYLTTSNPP